MTYFYFMMSSFFENNLQTSNTEILLPFLKEKNMELWMKREDLIHPEVSGNKFRKLKYNLIEAKHEQKETLLTFGGAFSNHILATASAAKMEGLKSVGVIRGEELGRDLETTLAENSTLRKAHEYGMEFVFLSRKAYRNKTSLETISELRSEFGDFYLIPEGGTNELAIKGCMEILTDEDSQFDYICSCVGTGGTISGLINSVTNDQKVLGYSALKGDFLLKEIQKFVDHQKNWGLITDYHFGGYAKYNEKLIHFINEFKKETSIALDPVYTGKMMFGIIDQIRKDKFPRGTKILVIHTGGLQGIEGFNQQLEKKNKTYRIDI